MELTQQVNRLGLFTASSIYKLLSKPRSGKELFGDGAITYIYEKIAEIITGERPPQAKSASLDWGNNYEKDAAMWLTQYFGVEFEYMGKENFKFFPYNEFSGGSPDGLNDDAVIELKCPYVSANHVKWLLANKEQSSEWLKANYPEYYAQVQFNMLCCKREKANITSYDPRTVDPKCRMSVLDIQYDALYVEGIKNRIDAGVDIIRNALKSFDTK